MGVWISLIDFLWTSEDEDNDAVEFGRSLPLLATFISDTCCYNDNEIH